MIPMTIAEIAELNTAYDREVAASPDESTHILTQRVAVAANLETVRRDDESGTLYRSADGRYVYGWQSGGFDSQID